MFIVILLFDTFIQEKRQKKVFGRGRGSIS
jgi:hypothetical protein